MKSSSDENLSFTGLSHPIDKGDTGYLFITADMGEAVGRHIFISGMPLGNITFEFGEKLGDSPTVAGGMQLFPVPHIEISSPPVVSATVEPRTTDLLLYRLDLEVTKAAAILESLTLTPDGTYRRSDIRTACPETETLCTGAIEQSLPVFKLWYSGNDILEEGDPVISEQPAVSSGSSLAFTGFSQKIPAEDRAYLFVTANIGPSVEGRTIRISETPFENITIGYREWTPGDPQAEKFGPAPLAAGGVQTFAETFASLLDMDGIRDYMEIPYHMDLNPSQFTVSALANVSRQQDEEGNTIMTRQTFVSSIDEDAYRGYEIFVDTDNKLKFRIGNGSNWTIVEGPEIVTDRFYDVTGTYNGTGMSLYVEGQPFGENTAAGFSPNTSDPLRIGSQPDGDFLFDGQIRELHIWNIPRTQPDIAASIANSPSDNEAGIVAHYRFIPWGTLVDTTGNYHDATISGSPAWASVTSGLWIGQIEISQVNEVGFGFADNDTPRDTANPFDIRILLHVDAEENVRMLRNVTLMQRRSSVEKDDGTTEETVRRVLVTDDTRLHEYEGVVRRDGKLVGIRLGTIFFDFDPSLNELGMDGRVREGASLTGDMTLAADHPNNPFRHLYHPDHRTGRDVNRNFTLAIDGEADLENPKAGTLELKGVYEEIIKGLHKIPIKMKGTFRLERVSTIPVLNYEG